METRMLLFVVIVVVAATVTATLAQSKHNRAATVFMRDKVEASQRVLEGLATEDYVLIISQGSRLSAMTNEAGLDFFAP